MKSSNLGQTVFQGRVSIVWFPVVLIICSSKEKFSPRNYKPIFSVFNIGQYLAATFNKFHLGLVEDLSQVYTVYTVYT